MSASVCGIFIIGYMIPGDRATKDIDVRGCRHEERDTNFCHECGAVMWRTVKERVLGEEDRFGRFNTRTATMGYGARARREIYVGLEPSGNRLLPEEVKPEKLQTLRDELDKELAIAGIDVEDCAFGIYHVAEVC